MNLQNQQLSGLYIIWETTEEGSLERECIEKEFQCRVKTNKRFSIEEIFHLSSHHAVGINFIPSTESFSIYGNHIVIKTLASDEELVTIMSNYMTNEKTYGYIKAKSVGIRMLPKEQEYRLERIGFHTSEILDIERIQ